MGSPLLLTCHWQVFLFQFNSPWYQLLFYKSFSALFLHLGIEKVQKSKITKEKPPQRGQFPSSEAAHQPTEDEVREYCKDFCVLPDYFKFHVLNLGMAGKFHLWRLDF